MDKQNTILIVDDEKNIREGLSKALKMEGYRILTAKDGNEAWDTIRGELVDLVITDLKMPLMSGEDLSKRILKHYPGLPVIIITGHGSVNSAVELMREGIYDYISKPIGDLDEFTILIQKALDKRNLERRNEELESLLDEKFSFKNIIGVSPAMQRIFMVMKQVAPSNANVLVTGESGTGKELIALAIHRMSNRKSFPLININCAALNENLLESELFGHEKGSFTGAYARKRGRFELADGGSLFLDEIGEITLPLQVKLLRVLQEREFERVGGEQTIKVDVRIIAATNKDLEEEVKKGSFRQDLFYRLNVVRIHLPPLRERKMDIPLMINTFVKEFCQLNNRGTMSLTSETIAKLENYTWEGNIRELRNVIEGLIVLTNHSVIQLDDLPPHIRGYDLQDPETHHVIKPGITLQEAEKYLITETLKHVMGNKSKAAKMLEIGRKTLHRKIIEYGIQSG